MQIYYFSRTGRSEKIAKSLADKHGTSARKINDFENWDGALNFIKAGAKASKKQCTKIEYTPLDKDKTTVLVFPLWAGTFPPAIRTFLDENSRENIIAIPTSLVSKLSDRQGFLKVYDLIGKVIDDDIKI